MSNPSERDKNIKQFRKGLKRFEKSGRDMGEVAKTYEKLRKQRGGLKMGSVAKRRRRKKGR